MIVHSFPSPAWPSRSDRVIAWVARAVSPVMARAPFRICVIRFVGTLVNGESKKPLHGCDDGLALLSKALDPEAYGVTHR